MSIQVHSSGISPNLQSKIITPSSSTQYIKPDLNYDGLNQVTVNGSSNLISNNIKNSVDIFGVTGNLSYNSFGCYDSNYGEEASKFCSVSVVLGETGARNSTDITINFAFNFLLKDGLYHSSVVKNIWFDDEVYWKLYCIFCWKISNQSIIVTGNQSYVSYWWGSVLSGNLDDVGTGIHSYPEQMTFSKSSNSSTVIFKGIVIRSSFGKAPSTSYQDYGTQFGISGIYDA